MLFAKEERRGSEFDSKLKQSSRTKFEMLVEDITEGMLVSYVVSLENFFCYSIVVVLENYHCETLLFIINLVTTWCNTKISNHT